LLIKSLNCCNGHSPNNGTRKKNSDCVGHKGLLSVQHKQVSCDSPSIYSCPWYRQHNKYKQPPKPVFSHIFLGPKLCFASYIKRLFFVEPPIQKVFINGIKEKQHQRIH